MRIAEVKGTITLTDGSTAQFRIGTDGVWSQWGHNDSRRAGEFVDALDAMARGLTDEDILGTDLDEDEVDDQDMESMYPRDREDGEGIPLPSYGA